MSAIHILEAIVSEGYVEMNQNDASNFNVKTASRCGIG